MSATPRADPRSIPDELTAQEIILANPLIVRLLESIISDDIQCTLSFA
jgi:hypothetical protein